MKTLLTGFLMLLLLSSCKSTSNSSSDLNIIGGRTTALYPAIGLLLDKDGGLCTATLIGPRLVLTAAHCLEGREPRDLIFRADRDYTIASLRSHPLYTAPDKGATHDIGYVTLAEASRIQPMVPEWNDLRTWSGSSVVNIGFGVNNASRGTGAGIKRQSQSRLTEVRSTTLRTEASNSNVCDGDSGGPLLLVQGSNVKVLGVASYVDLNCARYSIYTRVDRYKKFLSGESDDPLPCGSVTEMGACEGTSLKVCVEDKVQTFDCASQSKTCDWDDIRGTYGCI